MEVSRDNKKHDVKAETVTFKELLIFEFAEAGHRIKLDSSKFSGKVLLFIDDKVVTSKYSFRRKCSLDFNLNKDIYEVEFNAAAMFNAEIYCTLIKNGIHVKTIKKALHNESKNETKKLKPWEIVLIWILTWGLLYSISPPYGV